MVPVATNRRLAPCRSRGHIRQRQGASRRFEMRSHSRGCSSSSSSSENFCTVVKMMPPDSRDASISRCSSRLLAGAGVLHFRERRGASRRYLGHAELLVQLSVQFVAVGDHDQRRVLHRRLLQQLARIATHGNALCQNTRLSRAGFHFTLCERQGASRRC